MPPTEKRGRVHTSTVTVAVLEEKTQGAEAFNKRDDADYRIEWYSGSGAGGQHRNKHQNSCRLTHLPTGIVRTAQTRKRETSLRQARLALDTALDQLATSSAGEAVNGKRRDQVGSGMRGDKVRTYRFQEDRVCDHRTGKISRADKVMNGHFEALWR